MNLFSKWVGISFLVGLCGCREEVLVKVHQPENTDTVAMVAESESGQFILMLKFPEDRPYYLQKTQFRLVMETTSSSEIQISAKPLEDSPFLPEKISLEAHRTVVVQLRENLAFKSAHAHDDDQFSDDRLSNLPIGSIITDKTEWWLIPEASRCTGFLVSKDLVVTNNHCIATRQECERSEFNVWNFKESWLKRNLATSKFACSQILFTDSRRDQTLFRIKGDASAYSHFEPRKMAFEMNEGNIFRISSMHQNGFGHLYRYHRKCILESKMKAANGDKLRALALCDHDIFEGNSGSPVFDDDGQVMGVLWGKLKADSRMAAFNPLHPTLIGLVEQESAH